MTAADMDAWEAKVRRLRTGMIRCQRKAAKAKDKSRAMRDAVLRAHTARLLYNREVRALREMRDEPFDLPKW